MKIEYINCPLCNENDYITKFKSNINIENKELLLENFRCTSKGLRKHGQIVKCRKCGLVYQNPRYSEEIISKIYERIVDKGYLKKEVKNWPIIRKILSNIANYLLKIFLNSKVNDNTSNFRCYNISVLKKISYNKIKHEGYSFLFELIYKCQQFGFRLIEIPIIFIDRKYGFTKISKNEIFKAFRNLWGLFFFKPF